MKRLKLLVIAPRYAEPGCFYFFPLGLAYITSSLRRHGFDVSTLNLSNSSGPIDELIAETISKRDIDLALTGGMSNHWNKVSDVLEKAKRAKPSLITIAGGPIVTATPTLAYDNLQMDFGVLGEGELTSVELVSALEKGARTDDIDGLVYRNGTGKATLSPPRRVIDDLDSVAFPDYEAMEFGQWSRLEWTTPAPEFSGVFFDIDHDLKLGEIISSRSCPFDCTFCYHPLGKKYRQRSMDNIFSEIDLLVENYGVNVIRVQDELFSMNESRIVEFAERIKGYGIKWTAQWRVENVNRNIIQKVKDSNAMVMGFGIESMNDIVLKSMKKKTTKVQIENALSLAREAGILTGGNIIFGDPAETFEIANDSFNWWLAHPQHNINIGLILSVPDSALYRIAIAKGLIHDEVEFLRYKSLMVNVSSMNDWEYWKLRKKVTHYQLTHKRLLKARVVLSEKTSDKFNGNDIWEFTIECPSCGQESKYRHVLLPDYAKHFPVICRQCFSFAKAKTSDVFPGFSPLRSYATYIKIQLWHFYHVFFHKYKFIRNVKRFITGQ